MQSSQPTSKELTVNATTTIELGPTFETAARILAYCQRCAMTKRAQQDIVEVARELDLMRFMRIENGCLITD